MRRAAFVLLAGWLAAVGAFLPGRARAAAEGTPWRWLTSPDSVRPGRTLDFRRAFTLAPDSVVSAVARVSGLGFYELRVNGVSPDSTVYMAPLCSPYGRYTLYDTYDVTSLLREQGNLVEVQVAPGYDTGFSPYGWTYEPPMRMLFSMEVTYARCGADTLVSDGYWECAVNHERTYASIYHGETINRHAPDNRQWKPVKTLDLPVTGMRASWTPPVRLLDPRHPSRMWTVADGTVVVDFGQNRAGVVELRLRGRAGDTVRVHTSELVDTRGRIDPWTNRSARSADTCVLAGDGVEVFRPRYTYHGFRYAEISGLRGPLDSAAVTGWAVHADVPATGFFHCSDTLFNRLYEAAKWSMWSNLMGYPTDCSMRDERTPCLMDSHAYEEAACQFFDMRGFYDKWLLDTEGSRGLPDWTGDYASLVWILYRHTGDKELLRRYYPDVKGYISNYTGGYGDYICKAGYGDWCHANNGTWNDYFGNVELTNTALFCQILDYASRSAGALGLTADSLDYRRQWEEARRSFNDYFYRPDEGHYDDGSQTSYVLPLAFGLVPADRLERVRGNLVRRIVSVDGGHMTTGIFGTRYLPDALCDMDRADLLYDMYTHPGYPGYGYLFVNGATTLWEQWSREGSMNSHNHAMFAGGVECLFSRVAGIQPARAGYDSIAIAPHIPRQIESGEALRLTPAGPVRVAWRHGANRTRLVVEVPHDRATLCLEPGRVIPLAAGRNEVDVRPDGVWYNGKALKLSR